VHTHGSSTPPGCCEVTGSDGSICRVPGSALSFGHCPKRRCRLLALV
jgi:hypothetical protein